MIQDIHFIEPAFPPICEEPFDPAWDFGVAAQHIVLEHFRRMLAWRTAVWHNEEIEGVHQIRVEARRTRTALQTFAELWNSAETKSFGDYLARFATAFGAARDIDVMILHLEGELTTTQDERHTAYAWLLERNKARRLELQPKLEKQLLSIERSGFPAAFAAYFSTKPFDLWSISARQPSPDAADPVLVELHNG